MTTRRAQGIDISAWQKEFNPTNKRKEGIDFIVLRASKNRTKDVKFEDFYLESLNYPVRGAYHYYTTSKTESSTLIPEEKIRKRLLKDSKEKTVSVDGVGVTVKEVRIKTTHGTGANWQEQADLFLEQIKDKDFDFLALDIEKGHNPREKIGQTKNIFKSTDVENMVQWIDYVRKATNIPVIVYTRAVFLRDILIPLGGDKLKDMDLWLAWYGGDPEKDNPYKKHSIPGVSQSHWHIWQYSADKNKLGSEFGVKTSGIDLDVFNGTLQDMKDWLAGKAIQTGIPEEEEISETHEVLEAPVPVENQMEWITTQLEKLVAAGITPAVEINIEGTLFDVEKLKSLKETLEKGGITPEVKLSIDMSSNGNTSPRTKTPIDTSQTNPKTPPDRQSPSPTNHESFQVRASAMKKNKNFIPLYEIQKSKKTDEKGKPIMVKTNPVIRIPNDETFSVSSTHKVGSKDKGDGKVIGTGGDPYYLITDYSANDKAIGKYVMKDDVKWSS